MDSWEVCSNSPIFELLIFELWNFRALVVIFLVDTMAFGTLHYGQAAGRRSMCTTPVLYGMIRTTLELLNFRTLGDIICIFDLFHGPRASGCHSPRDRAVCRTFTRYATCSYHTVSFIVWGPTLTPRAASVCRSPASYGCRHTISLTDYMYDRAGRVARGHDGNIGLQQTERSYRFHASRVFGSQ